MMITLIVTKFKSRHRVCSKVDKFSQGFKGCFHSVAKLFLYTFMSPAIFVEEQLIAA